jgi:hypothetical protein
MLHLDDAIKYEIENSIASAWRLFWGMKSLLLNINVSVKRRLKLFDATVYSCVLWCCESWTPQTDELRLLRVARNPMLRRIAGCRRAQAGYAEDEYA